MRFYQSKGALRVKVPLSIYNRDVIFKCFYWYTGEYDIEINEDSNNANILISGKSDTKFDFDELKSKIKRDLIDFKTRDIISKETKNVRDLIIAKAFSDSDEFDSEPPGEITDPVGFKIKDKGI